MTTAPKTAAAGTHEGKVVSCAAGKLTTTGHDGKECCHTMHKDATVTHDGVAGKASDIKPGTHVRVTTHKDDHAVATHVESGKHVHAATATKA